MNSVKDTRRANLRRLIVDHGSVEALSKATGISRSYISHVIHVRRNLGLKLCKRIEEFLGLRAGWMDSKH